MQVVDAVAVFLVAGAAAAFTFGAMALTKSNDLEALYYLIVGIVALRAGIQVVRPGANA